MKNRNRKSSAALPGMSSVLGNYCTSTSFHSWYKAIGYSMMLVDAKQAYWAIGVCWLEHQGTDAHKVETASAQLMRMLATV